MKRLIIIIAFLLFYVDAQAVTGVYGRGESNDNVYGRVLNNSTVHGRDGISDTNVYKGGRTFGEVVLSNANLVAYWPLRSDGTELKGGNTMVNTNVTFTTGAAYYNGTTAYSRSTSSINLTGTNKVTWIANVKYATYDLVNNAVLSEFSNAPQATNGTFRYGVAGPSAGDPIWNITRGDTGDDAAYYNVALNLQDDGNYHFMEMNNNISLAGNEGNYYKDGVLLTASLRTPTDNGGNFGNFPLWVGARSSLTFFSRHYMNNMALFSSTLTSKERTQLNEAQ